MSERNSRTEAILGTEGLEKLKNSRVAVFGVGGVGGYVCEALARAGIGALDLFDRDKVSESNINRQIIALISTVGRYKTEVMAERIRDINPECRVAVHNVFYLPENADEFDFSGYNYVVDAVDTVAAKIEIITRAKRLAIPVISAMGAGNKLYPESFELADISKTSVCPLAKAVRKRLKDAEIRDVKVVFSKEEPRSGKLPPDPLTGKVPPGSISFVPSAMGLIIAGDVVRTLSGVK